MRKINFDATEMFMYYPKPKGKTLNDYLWSAGMFIALFGLGWFAYKYISYLI